MRIPPPKGIKELEVEKRIRLYRLIFYAQLLSTILIALGFILFILLVAGIIGI